MLNSGAKLGPYKVVAAVGVGGMGEVYRDHDTRLDCIVTIKVLLNWFEQLKRRVPPSKR